MDELLRSVWGEPRFPHPPRRVWRDWALVGVLVPVAVLEGVLRPDLPGRAVSVAVAAGLVPTLLWRRTRPLLMVGIALLAGLTVLVPGGPGQLFTSAYLLLLPYSLFRWGSGREAAIGLVLLLARAGLSTLSETSGAGDAVGAFAVLLAAVALGGAFRYRATARMREFDRVKLLERERLARELHDTVAHHVSAIAIRAQAGLATSASRPEAATEALRVIEQEASRTLTEMRRMVHLLRRNEPAGLAPGPRISDLEQLAGRTRSGPGVEVKLIGDLDSLPPQVGAAVYRLAQESVTNALRHARHATRIEVRVAADDTSVQLRVRDDGDAGTLHPSTPTGYGLVGMIERAHLLGGTCTAGPDPDRGWTVTAVLPRTGAPR